MHINPRIYNRSSGIYNRNYAVPYRRVFNFISTITMKKLIILSVLLLSGCSAYNEFDCMNSEGEYDTFRTSSGALEYCLRDSEFTTYNEVTLTEEEANELFDELYEYNSVIEL